MLFDVPARRFARRVLGLPPLLAALGAACSPVTVTTFGAGEDAGLSPDGGGGSSSGGSSSGGTADGGLCLPGDVSTFHPLYHPTSVRPGACGPTATQPDPVGAFYDACFGAGRSDQACRAFQAQNPDCAACIVSPESASSYGPIIDHGGFVTANVAGCIEVTVDTLGPVDASGTTPGACARAVEALDECQLAACEANCPVSASDRASLQTYEGCAAAVAATSCGPFNRAASCLEPDSGAGVPVLCATTDFATFYAQVVPLFCLPRAGGDAGTGAGPDAASGAPDAGVSPADAGASGPDAGASGPDAGASGPDAGAYDSGGPSAADAGSTD